MSWSIENTDIGGYEVPNTVPDDSREAVVGVIDDLKDQLRQNTQHALDAQMHEAYNRGYIDGVEWVFDQDTGEDVHNHFPNGIIGDGNYKSPIINIGSDNVEQTQGNYKSPEINVGSVPTAQSTNSAIDASRVPDSWDGYGLEDDMCDPEFSGEPVFDSPKSFVESQDIYLDGEQSNDNISIDVSYNGTNEDDLAFLNAAS